MPRFPSITVDVSDNPDSFSLLGRTIRIMRETGVPETAIGQFSSETGSRPIRDVVAEWVNVEGGPTHD